MSERKATLFCTTKCISVLDVLTSAFETNGILLEHPRTNRITILDRYGESSEVSKTDFVSLVMTITDVRFQWWIAEDHDIYCRMRTITDAVIIDFGFEGFTKLEQIGFTEVLLGVFCRLEQEQMTEGLVVDCNGVTTDYNWEDLFVKGNTVDLAKSILTLPTCLIVPKKLLSRIQNVPYDQLSQFGETFVMMSGRDRNGRGVRNSRQGCDPVDE